MFYRIVRQRNLCQITCSSASYTDSVRSWVTLLTQCWRLISFSLWSLGIGVTWEHLGERKGQVALSSWPRAREGMRRILSALFLCKDRSLKVLGVTFLSRSGFSLSLWKLFKGLELSWGGSPSLLAGYLTGLSFSLKTLVSSVFYSVLLNQLC